VFCSYLNPIRDEIESQIISVSIRLLFIMPGEKYELLRVRVASRKKMLARTVRFFPPRCYHVFSLINAVRTVVQSVRFVWCPLSARRLLSVRPAGPDNERGGHSCYDASTRDCRRFLDVRSTGVDLRDGAQ